LFVTEVPARGAVTDPDVTRELPQRQAVHAGLTQRLLGTREEFAAQIAVMVRTGASERHGV
jgi:BMFP domain-containing protein YqiC